MLEQIAGKRKIDYAFFNEMEIRYASHDPLDPWIHVWEKTFPRIYGDPAASDYIIYEISVAATKIENTIVW